MSDEPGQQEQAEEEDAESGPIDFLDPCLALGDGECWIADAELLLPGEDDAEGEDQVIAIQFTVERGLWFMTRKERWWRKAEQQEPPKKAALQPIKGGKR